MTKDGEGLTQGAGLPDFYTLINNAQEAHKARNFDLSCIDYERAENQAPNNAEKARAMRGHAVALDRLGVYDDALAKAYDSFNLYESEIQAATTPEYHAKIRREKVEGRNVLGRMIVAKAARGQLERRLDYTSAHRKAQKGIAYLDDAYQEIGEIERQAGGETDQYRINLVSRLAVAHSIYGDRTKAGEYVQETKKLAHLSESPELSTAAQLSREYGNKSRSAAIVRSAAASAIFRFSVLRPSPVHTFALRLATDYRIGL